MEKWKDIENFECYQISNLGRVRRKQRLQKTPTGQEGVIAERILKPFKSTKGYLRIELNCYGKRKIFSVHRLVALAFLDNPLNKPQVNHIDGDKTNNNITNLEWCTNSENQLHSYKNNLNRKIFFKENNPKKREQK